MATPKTVQIPAGDFEPDSWMIRTTDANGRSYNEFEWPREVGAVVTCPDWSPVAECGYGLHGLLDGIGDWSLLSDSPAALWWVVGVMRAEVVDIDDDKVKVPRGKVAFFGDFPGAMKRITQQLVPRVLALAEGNTATGYRGHAAATGGSGHAAATGYSGHAAATGDSSHAAATGGSGHAAATGDSGHAAATGYRGHAAATGYRGHAEVKGKNAIAAALGIFGVAKAEEGGAIALAAYDADFNLVAVRASLVGQNGVEGGKTYRLTPAGEFEPVAV